MAGKKKTNYIDAELDWAEIKLQEWQTYINDNPIDTLLDRIEWKKGKYGKIPQVIATIEAQGKYIQEMIKNYLSLLNEVKKMRMIDEDKKKEARGLSIVPHRMQ